MSEIYMTEGRKKGRGGCRLKRHIKADKLQQFLTVHVNDQARPLSLYQPLSLPRALCLIAQSLARSGIYCRLALRVDLHELLISQLKTYDSDTAQGEKGRRGREGD